MEAGQLTKCLPNLHKVPLLDPSTPARLSGHHRPLGWETQDSYTGLLNSLCCQVSELQIQWARPYRRTQWTVAEEDIWHQLLGSSMSKHVPPDTQIHNKYTTNNSHGWKRGQRSTAFPCASHDVISKEWLMLSRNATNVNRSSTGKFFTLFLLSVIYSYFHWVEYNYW